MTIVKKTTAKQWYRFGWNDARGGAVGNAPKNATHRKYYREGFRDYPSKDKYKKNPNGPSHHNAMWLATVGFIRNLQKANREQIEDAIIGAKQGMNDYALPANERKYYKVVLPILRKELKDFGPRKKNPANRFTKKQLDTLRKEYGNIQRIDPGLQGYAKLVDFLDNLPPAQLKQLEKAHIKFVSGLARNRLIRSENPVKKKRSAKQLANDKRLGRMAKARAKKKRGGRRKVVKRKVVKRKVAKRRVVRNPQKARPGLKKSHLWYVFKCYGKHVRYLGLTTAGKSHWTIRDAAVIWKTKSMATNVARSVAKWPKMSQYDIGVASSDMTSTQIAASCRKGKA